MLGNASHTLTHISSNSKGDRTENFVVKYNTRMWANIENIIR